MFVLGLVWEGGGMRGSGVRAWTAAWCRQRRGQPTCPWPPALEVRGWPSLRPVTTALGACFRRYTALSTRP